MKKQPSHRELRRVLGSGVPETVGMLVNNDQVTQKRIVALEGRADQAEAFRALSFWQRMRWLMRGEQ